MNAISPIPETRWELKLPDETLETMQRTKQVDPQLFTMEEDALWDYLTAKKLQPSSTACMLRLRFWDEYERAEGRKMHVQNIYHDVCMYNIWNRIIRDPNSLAWILTPTRSMLTECDEYIDALMRNLKGVVRIKSIDKHGKLDMRAARLQFEMLMYFDQRKNGAIVQKIEQTTKSMNVTANISTSDHDKISSMVKNMTEEDMQKRLDDLRKKPDIEVKAE